MSTSPHTDAHHSQSDIILDPTLADLTANGEKALLTVGEIVVAGDTLFLQNDGKYWQSDADAAATMPIKAMAVAGIAADATGLCLLRGYYRNDGLYNWAPGAGVANLLYAHTTVGEIVQFVNRPVGSGDQLQVVGYIVNADVLFFDPCLVLAEIV